MGMRNIYISVLAFIGIMSLGILLFRDSQAALGAVQAVAFAAGFTLLHLLDGRDRRRRHHGS